MQVRPHQDRGFQLLQNQGHARTLRTEPISPYRGVITDRNGEPLAVSTPVGSLWVEPQVLVREQHRLAEMSNALGWDHELIDTRLAQFSTRDIQFFQSYLHIHSATTGDLLRGH